MITVRELETALYDAGIDYEVICGLNLPTLKSHLEDMGCDDEVDELIGALEGGMSIKDLSIEKYEREDLFGRVKNEQKIIIKC